ncbi:MAG: spore cortex biosynthesis protein YabQ [Oscillospiraceae bacterium]|nr:spore cortex biosynthesis protein YabQ [Oscillospiraceae bacterium]
MELPVLFQGSQFLLAAALGLFYGICYDLFRGLRRSVRGLTLLSDLLFCLICLSGNLLFAFYIGQGEYRIFMLVACGIGAAVYFCTLSRLVLPCFRLFWRLLLLPFRIIRRILGKMIKKFYIFSKKVFSFGKKSVKIKGHKKRMKTHRQEGSDCAPAQIVADHDAHSSGAAGILHHHHSHSPAQNQRS